MADQVGDYGANAQRLEGRREPAPLAAREAGAVQKDDGDTVAGIFDCDRHGGVHPMLEETARDVNAPSGRTAAREPR